MKAVTLVTLVGPFSLPCLGQRLQGVVLSRAWAETSPLSECAHLDLLESAGMGEESPA